MLAPPLPKVPLELPVRLLDEVSVLDAMVSWAPVKALLPIPILFAVAVPIAWFFRATWKELDAEAAAHRAELTAHGKMDYRPAVCFAIVAAVLTMQEYYGSRPFYDETFREALQAWSDSG